MQTSNTFGNNHVLTCKTSLIDSLGRVEAHLISQILYWIKNPKCGHQYDGVNWVYNTATEWARQIRFSESSVRRAISKLKRAGIITTKQLSRDRRDRTNYFSINYSALETLINTQNDKDLDLSKLADASCQNERMYNDTKITNKDINKSDKFAKNPKVVGQGASETEQVKQVKNLNLKNEKKLDALQEFTTTCLAIKKNKANETNPSMPKTTTAQDMLKVWNDSFAGKFEAKAKLNKELAPLLVSAFKNKFESNLKNWQNYCDQLKSSSYLMGGSFKLTFGWALKFCTIDRIRAGELGVKISPRDTSTGQGAVIDEVQITQMIEALPDSATSKALRHKIAKAIGCAAYYSWFHAAKFCEEGGAIRMVAPNAFVEQYWEMHFNWVLKGVRQ